MPKDLIIACWLLTENPRREPGSSSPNTASAPLGAAYYDGDDLENCRGGSGRCGSTSKRRGDYVLPGGTHALLGPFWRPGIAVTRLTASFPAYRPGLAGERAASPTSVCQVVPGLLDRHRQVGRVQGGHRHVSSHVAVVVADVHAIHVRNSIDARAPAPPLDARLAVRASGAAGSIPLTELARQSTKIRSSEGLLIVWQPSCGRSSSCRRSASHRRYRSTLEAESDGRGSARRPCSLGKGKPGVSNRHGWALCPRHAAFPSRHSLGDTSRTLCPAALRLLWHVALRAFSLALANTGKRIAARIAIIAITTSSSIKVNPRLFDIVVPFQTGAQRKPLPIGASRSSRCPCSVRPGSSAIRSFPLSQPPRGGVNAPSAYAKAALVSLVKGKRARPQKRRGEPPEEETPRSGGQEEAYAERRRWSGFRPTQ